MGYLFKRSIFVCVLIVIALFFTLFVRTWSFSRSASETDKVPIKLIDIDAVKAAQNLSKAIQYKTVTEQDSQQSDWSIFVAFQDWLREIYPDFYNNVRIDYVANYTPILTWEGSDPTLDPIIFLAHQDVVPASETDPAWDYNPFDGIITDEYIYGRGAIDTKSSLIGLHEAANQLARTGFKPQRTLIFIFPHDEEVESAGAIAAAKWLQSNDISAHTLIDEGGFILSNFQGIEKNVALISVTEKDYFTVKLVARSEGGHSSAPPKYKSISALSRAIYHIESNPFESGLNHVTRATLKALAREQDFQTRLAMSNLWLFEGVVEKEMYKQTATRALLETSVAPTIIDGGFKENALPREASAHINFRIHPRDSRESVIAHLERVIDDPEIEIIPLSDPLKQTTHVSPLDSEGYALLKNTLQDIYPDIIVAPNQLSGGTDARYFNEVTQNIYRFTPMLIDISDLPRIHGVNERVGIKNFANAVQVYNELISRAGTNDVNQH